MNISLIGDSILDNVSYVADGKSVPALLQTRISSGSVKLLAKDGSVATEAMSQLEKLPAKTTHIVLSCGGNDALRAQLRFDEGVDSVEAALKVLDEIVGKFARDYSLLLDSLVRSNSKILICTIYNSMPGISSRLLTALRLFNDVVAEQASARNLPILDLRKICTDTEDYSPVSPIEPSAAGGEKIVTGIVNAFLQHDYSEPQARIYG